MGFAYRTTLFVLMLAVTVPTQWVALKLKLPILRTLPCGFTAPF